VTNCGHYIRLTIELIGNEQAPELKCNSFKSGLGTFFSIYHLKGRGTVMGTFEGKIYINKTVFDSGVRFSNCLPCKLPTSATNLEDVIILATFESCLAVLHPDDLEDTTAEITQMLQ